MREHFTRSAALAGMILGLGGCYVKPPELIPPVVAPLPVPVAVASVDDTPKQDLRMVPAEAYVRTYLQLFGGLAPLDAQKRARGGDGAGLFDSWSDYFTGLGFPDYRIDMPRGTQTNTIMLATFERLGVALCDRAVEHDLNTRNDIPLKDRVIFTFDAPKGSLDALAFDARFNVLHRKFLGYPINLAPPSRTPRFHRLYDEIVAMHAEKGAPKSRFSPEQAGWAAVCYGLVRHPEFQLY